MCDWTTGVFFVIFLSNCDAWLKNDSFKGLRHTHKGSRGNKPLNMPFSIDDYDSKINIVFECDSIYIICIEKRLNDMLIRIRYVKESIKVILEYITFQYNLEIKLDICIAKKSISTTKETSKPKTNSTTTTIEYKKTTEPTAITETTGITESTEVTETKPTSPNVEYTDITDSTKITESPETTATYKPKTKSTASTVDYTEITDSTEITESTETTEKTTTYIPKTKRTTKLTTEPTINESSEKTDSTKITETMTPTMTTDYDDYTETTTNPCPPDYHTTKASTRSMTTRRRPTIYSRTTLFPPCVTTTKDSKSESDSSSYESDEDPSMRRSVKTKNPNKITSSYSLNPYAIETVLE